jgi:uncharacterized protein (DUF3084 family)
MKKLTKNLAKKGEVAELKLELLRLKRESNGMIKKLDLRIKRQEGTIQTKGAEIEKLKIQLEKKRKDLFRLKKEHSSKIKELDLKVGEITDLRAAREVLHQKEIQLKRLRVEIEYKNKRLGSKDLEMETYKKVTDEKIFQLAAKVKELEGKISESSPKP